MDEFKGTVYLGGPMRGYVEYNFPEFFRVAALLEKYGYVVVNPAAHDVEQGVDPKQPLPESFNLRDTLMWDLEQVSRADYLVLLEGWRGSSGAVAEYALAQALDIPCYQFTEFFGGWTLEIV